MKLLILYFILFFLSSHLYAETVEQVPPITNQQTKKEPDQASSNEKNNEKEKTVGDYISLETPSWVTREWDKLKIRYGVNTGFQANEYFGSGIEYKALIEPAYIKNYQLRTDKYTVNLNYGIPNTISIGGGFSASVIFAQLFETKMLGLNPLRMYFLDRFPWKAEDVIKKLKVTDAVRFEFYADVGIGGGSRSSSEDVHRDMGIRATVSSRFVVDIYKMDENKVRVRLTGIRADGTLGASIGINPVTEIDMGSGYLSNRVERWLRCRVLEISADKNKINWTPIETVLVDYVFNLSMPTGREVYNQTLKGIKALPVKSLGVFLRSSKRVVGAINQLSLPAETQFLIERDKPLNERSVDRVSKAIATLGNTSVSFGSSCSKFYKFRISSLFNEVHVMWKDRYDTEYKNIFTTSGKELVTSGFFSYFGKTTNYSINGIFDAGENFYPLSFTNLYMRGEHTDKNFTRKNFKDWKKLLAYTIPSPLFEKIKFNDFMNSKKILKTFIRYEMVVNKDALEMLPYYSLPELAQLLKKYILNHPEAEYLPASNSSISPDEYSSQSIESKTKEDVKYISEKLFIAFNPERNNQERYDAFEKVNSNELFKEIGPGFILSLLPQEGIENIVRLKFSAGSADNKFVEYSNLKPEDSELFRSINYILSAINDRSFDMRLQVDQDEYLYISR